MPSAGEPRPGEAPAEPLDRAPCGLLSTAADGTILAVNATFLAWTGFERADLVGVRRLDELFTLPCRLYHETHHAPLLRLQGHVDEIAVDIVTREGGVVPAFMNSEEKRHADGSVELVRVAIFAARARRTYERELLLERRNAEEAVKAKADFLAMFAHEIRNPLAAAVLHLELLEHRGVLRDHGKAVVPLRASFNKVIALLDNMLEISKLDAGKVALNESDFEVADVLRAAVHTMGPLAERKGLPVEIHVDPQLPRRLRGDPVKLDHALINLVGNAIKFTETGTVAVSAEKLGVSDGMVDVRFAVRDTGIGIPADRQASIFDDFVQADASVARRFGGTGLGLAITRKLVELLGGHLGLNSVPGRGSTFFFALRLQPAP